MSSRESSEEALGHHQHTDCCLQLMDMFIDGVRTAPAPKQSSPVQGKSTYRADLQVFCGWMATDFTSDPSKMENLLS